MMERKCDSNGSMILKAETLKPSISPTCVVLKAMPRWNGRLHTDFIFNNVS
jgi:hypothetical protein